MTSTVWSPDAQAAPGSVHRSARTRATTGLRSTSPMLRSRARARRRSPCTSPPMRRPFSLLLLLVALLALARASPSPAAAATTRRTSRQLLSDTFGAGERVKQRQARPRPSTSTPPASPGCPRRCASTSTGPFQGMGASEPPKFDFDLALEDARRPRADRRDLDRQEELDEARHARLHAARRRLRRASSSSGKDDASGGLSTFGVDPRPWMRGRAASSAPRISTASASSTCAPASTCPALIEDLGGLFGRAGGAAGGGGIDRRATSASSSASRSPRR